jgi:hypothetical protein
MIRFGKTTEFYGQEPSDGFILLRDEFPDQRDILPLGQIFYESIDSLFMDGGVGKSIVERQDKPT